MFLSNSGNGSSTDFKFFQLNLQAQPGLSCFLSQLVKELFKHLKGCYSRFFERSQFSDKPTVEETDLALAYCFKSISKPEILDEGITVGEAIDRMKIEIKEKK